MNILDSILFQCRYQPNAAALCAPGSEIVTYARLEKQINNVARRATSLGLLQGNVVVLAIVAPLVEAVVILGLSRLGIVKAAADQPFGKSDVPNGWVIAKLGRGHDLIRAQPLRIHQSGEFSMLPERR